MQRRRGEKAAATETDRHHTTPRTDGYAKKERRRGYIKRRHALPRANHPSCQRATDAPISARVSIVIRENVNQRPLLSRLALTRVPSLSFFLSVSLSLSLSRSSRRECSPEKCPSKARRRLLLLARERRESGSLASAPRHLYISLARTRLVCLDSVFNYPIWTRFSQLFSLSFPGGR